MRVYLDACCLSRLTDDPLHARIREEAEAVERVLAAARRGMIGLLSSEALEDEVRRNPFMERRVEAQTILSLAVARVVIDAPMKRTTRKLGNPRIPVRNPLSSIKEQELWLPSTS